MFRDLESGVQRDVADYAELHGWAAHKLDTRSNRGRCDYVFIRAAPGHRGLTQTFYIEFKRPREKPTPLQEKRHTKLREMGLRVYVVDNKIDGREVIDAETNPL